MHEGNIDDDEWKLYVEQLRLNWRKLDSRTAQRQGSGGRRECAHYCNVGNEGDYAGHFIRTREQCILAGSVGVQTRKGSIGNCAFFDLTAFNEVQGQQGKYS
jgi:hypothetical protein